MTRCNPFRQLNRRNRRPFDPQEKDLIQAQSRLFRRMRRAASSIPDVAQSKLAAEARRAEVIAEWTDQTADLIRLSPSQGKRLTDFLVTQFGIKARKLGLDPSNDFTVAGEVRYGLEAMQQAAEGLINLSGRISSMPVIKSFVDTLDSVFEGKNLTEPEKRMIQVNALEVGRIPQTLSLEVQGLSAMGKATPVHTYLSKLYTDYLSDLISKGFSFDEINQIADASFEVSQVFNKVRTVATALGVFVPELENLGYFSRIATSDFKAYLKDLNMPDLYSQVMDGGSVYLGSVFSRSRKTNFLMPWDKTIASVLLDVTPSELDLMIENPSAFTQFVHDALTPDQVDTLVESGVLARLPMTSAQVYNYFVSQYNLPMKDLGQMFVLDPYSAIQRYTNSLQNAAGQSAMIRGMVDGRAISAGFAITKDMIDASADPSKYADFVPLGNYLQEWANRSKIDLSQMLISSGQVKSAAEVQAFLQQMGNTFVHPIVADQWKAIMNVSVNPALMGQMAYNLQKVGSVFSKSVIMSSGAAYVLNNARSSMITIAQLGGNMLRYLPNFFDVLKAMRNGLDVFDNTKPYVIADGKTLTRRELIETFLIRRGQHLTPGIFKTPSESGFLRSSSMSDFAKAVLDTPAAIAQTLTDIVNYTMANGDMVNGRTISPLERVGRFTEASLRKMYEGLDPYFNFLATSSNIVEMAAKLTVLESVLKKATPLAEGLGTAGQLMTGFSAKSFNTLDEAFRHIDAGFVNPYSVGSSVRYMGQFIMPFASWRMNNPPMQIRHFTRRPILHGNYLRLIAMNQEDLTQEDQAIEAAIEPWVLEAYPWYIGKDREGKPLMLIPQSYDPFIDSMIFFNETGDKVRRVLGYGAKTEAGKREDIKGETAQEWINSFIGSTYFKLPYEVISGIDTFTGQKMSENAADQYPDFLGMNMPPRLYLIAKNLPFLSKLDQMNPGGVFGRAAELSPSTGQVVKPGQPSWAGATRGKVDRRNDAYDSSGLWGKVLMLSGMNVRTIDYNKNLQNTYSDIDLTISFLEKSINENRQQITIDAEKGKIGRDEFARRRAVIEDQVSIWGQMLIDRMRLASYMKTRGVKPKDVLKQLDTLGLRVRDLPLPGDEELKSVAQKVIVTNQQLNELEGKLK